jgi:hypothetical protein
LCVHPFGDEICQDLGLNYLAWRIGERLALEFQRSLGDPTRRVRVTDDFSQQEGGNYRNRVGLEVVLEIATCEHHRIEQLLDWRIPWLGLG